MNRTVVIVSVIVLIILYMWWYRQKEEFCSTCVGPTAHMYKYGDPFYEYQQYQRKRYAKFPPRVNWMNETKEQRIMDTESEKKLIDNWILRTDRNKYGDPPFTKYAYGNPLLDDDGQQIYENRYQYILANHFNQPWLIN